MYSSQRLFKCHLVFDEKFSCLVSVTETKIIVNMDKRTGKPARPRLSQADMARYLGRFKLKKKQRQILPRTYANSQGLSRLRLQQTVTSAPAIKKPILSNNVKARLESNLQYLLENQKMVPTRVKQAESYLSLPIDEPKRVVDQNRSGNKTSKTNTFAISRTDSSAGSRGNKHHDIEPQISGFNQNLSLVRVPTPKSPTFFGDDDSFTFDTVESQTRAGGGMKTPALSGVSSSFFKDSPNKSCEVKRRGWSMDEPNYTEPPSVSPDRYKLPQNLFRPMDSPMDSPTNSFDLFVPERHHRRTSRFVRRTRVTKSSLSRAGESPFMEQIVIQRVKHPY